MFVTWPKLGKVFLVKNGVRRNVKKLKSHFAVSLFSLLHWFGFYWFWRYLSRDQIVILSAHGVMDEGESTLWTPTRSQISREHLDESIRLISKYYQFVSMTEAVDMLSGKQPFRPHCIVLTFDDGYRNTLTHAWPILERHGAPASVYPVTGHVESREPFWFERLDYAVQKAANVCDEFRMGEAVVTVRRESRDTLKATVKEAIVAAKSIPGNDIEARECIDRAISFLEKKSGARLNDISEIDAWSASMTWAEVKEASEVGLEVGSHTVDHARLGLLDEQEVWRQLNESKKTLERVLDKPVDFLCYPNGSYSDVVLKIARDAGYRAALTTKEGVNKQGDDLFQLKRFHIPQGPGRTAVESLAVASGLLFELSKLKMRLLSVFRG